MMNWYPSILGLFDTLNEWDQKLKEFTTGNSNNVAFASILIIVVFLGSIWAINFFQKR